MPNPNFCMKGEAGMVTDVGPGSAGKIPSDSPGNSSWDQDPFPRNHGRDGSEHPRTSRESSVGFGNNSCLERVFQPWSPHSQRDLNPCVFQGCRSGDGRNSWPWSSFPKHSMIPTGCSDPIPDSDFWESSFQLPQCFPEFQLCSLDGFVP